MAKFKAGDRVRCITKNWGNCCYEPDKIYTVKRVCDNGRIITDADGAGNGENGWDDYNFELVSQSPIRTVTKREIVSGTYGIVTVSAPKRISIFNDTYGPVALRNAAQTLIEIADYLDENAKDAA